MRKRNCIWCIAVISVIVLFLITWMQLYDHDELEEENSSTINPDVNEIGTLFPPQKMILSLTPSIFSSPMVHTPTWGVSSEILPTLTSTPEYGSIQVIGFSVEGRPLEVYQFGYGEHAYMILAGIHGGYEWNTVKLADGLIATLKENKTIVPENRKLYILRLLNPDGYEKSLGPDGRANANNVDLNRNWDANWQTNWYGTHCWNYRFLTAGKEPMSEPETKALAKFLIENNIEALISYHSASLGIFAGGWPNDKNSMNLAYTLSLVSPYAYPPISSDCVYTGQLIDWASAHGIAAVDVELSNHVDTDLQINLRVLDTFLNWESDLP